jgi:hypothetical protein
MGQISDKIKDWLTKDAPGRAVQGLPTGTPLPTPQPTQTDVSLDSVTNAILKRKKLLEEANKP